MKTFVLLTENTFYFSIQAKEDRYWSRRILQIHKIRNNCTPVYLIEKLPPLRRPKYRITNQNNFPEISCQTHEIQEQFFSKRS